LGLVKKDKQLDERKLCSFFAKPQKQRRPPYFSSNTYYSYTSFNFANSLQNIEKMLKDFREFIFRGNVMDLAVGVIIGAAFNGIVDALVKKLIMPLIGILTGGINFEKEVFKFGDAELGWGAVIQAIIQFLIIGFVLFMILRTYRKIAKKDNGSYAPEPTPSEALLADIKLLMQKMEENTRK
jgi:large conductance mechanosensitive channel